MMVIIISTNVAFAQDAWQKMNGPVDTLYSSQVECLCASPADDIYAGIFQHGIYHSTDAGGHWQPASNGFVDTMIGAPVGIIVCKDGSVLASTFGQGLYRSTDHGANWFIVEQGQSFGVYFPSVSFALANNGYVFMGTDSGVFRSEDNGISWVYSGLSNARNITIDDSGNIFVYGNYRMIYESADNGNSWVNKANRFFSFGLLSDDRYLFNIYIQNKILRSSDKGTTWDTLVNGSNISANVLYTHGGYIFEGTDSGVYRSSNYGTTWLYASNGLGNVPIYSFTSDSVGYIYTGTYTNGIYRSSDNGQNWIHVMDSVSRGNYDKVTAMANDSSGDILTAVVAPIYDTTITSGLFRSGDSGVSWNKIFKGISYVQSIAVKDHATIFIGTNANGIYRTTNNGASWQAVNTGLDTLNVLSLLVAPNGTILAGASGYAGLYSSTDNGTTWKVSDSGFNSQSVFSLLTTSKGTLLAATSDSGIHRSTDNGKHWSNIRSSPYITSMILEKNGSIFAPVGADYFISDDDGIHWAAYGRLRGGISSVGTDRRGYIYAQTYRFGLNRSKDNGQSWEEVNSGLVIPALAFAHDDKYIYAATDSGVFRADSPAVAILPSSHSGTGAGPLRVAGMNTVSNIEFWQQNFGMSFLNTSVSPPTWGTFWPRGYYFHYIFGGGFWFGDVNNNSRHVLVGYDPSTGLSWFQPGTIDAAREFYNTTKKNTGTGLYPDNSDSAYAKKYIVYLSTSYDRNSGKSLNPVSPPWPMWDTDPDTNKIVGYDHYFGSYVDSIPFRDTSVYPIRYLTKYIRHVDTLVIGGRDSIVVTVDTVKVKKGGPAFVSDEDMFTVCNSLDTTYYVQSTNTGYPALETQRTIYSWGSGTAQNYLWLVYTIINKSNFTLDSCWFAPVLDPDIGIPINDEDGYYQKDSTMNFAMQWSEPESGVPGAKNQSNAYPGVLGMKFLQTPVLYKQGEVADSLVGTLKSGFYLPDKQIGLITYKRWDIPEVNGDPTKDEDRYQFMANRTKDTALGQYSDKRALLATGPFKLLAGQSAQIAWGLVIARDSSTEADVDLALSMNECVSQAREMQILYDNTLNPAGEKTAVAENRNSSVNNWSLNAYPNPFMNTAHLSFMLSQVSPVTIVLYDMMGREVKQLAERRFYDAGTHTLAFDASGLPSGVYMCVFSTTSETTQKMISLTR